MSKKFPTQSGNPWHKENGEFGSEDDNAITLNREKEKRTLNYIKKQKRINTPKILTKEERGEISRLAQNNLPDREPKQPVDDLTEIYKSRADNYNFDFSPEDNDDKQMYKDPKNALSKLVYDKYIFDDVISSGKLADALKQFNNIEFFRPPTMNYGNNDKEKKLDSMGIDCLLYFKSYDKDGTPFCTPVGVDMKFKTGGMGVGKNISNTFEFNILKSKYDGSKIIPEQLEDGNFINTSKKNNFYLICDGMSDYSVEDLKREIKDNEMPDSEIRKMKSRIKSSQNHLLDIGAIKGYLLNKLGLRKIGVNLGADLKQKANELINIYNNGKSDKKEITVSNNENGNRKAIYNLFKRNGKTIIYLVAKKNENGETTVNLRMDKKIIKNAGLSIDF